MMRFSERIPTIVLARDCIPFLSFFPCRAISVCFIYLGAHIAIGCTCYILLTDTFSSLSDDLLCLLVVVLDLTSTLSDASVTASALLVTVCMELNAFLHAFAFRPYISLPLKVGLLHTAYR